MRSLSKTAMAVAWLLGCPLLQAATPIETLRHSPDTTVVLDGVTVGDQEAVADDLSGTVIAIDLGTLPSGLDVDAYHQLAVDEQLFSLDTTVDLPGGILARPADVVLFDGSIYVLELEAANVGIPDHVNVDAVARLGVGLLLLSFDVSVDIGGAVADDEDLVLWDGNGLSLYLDGSTAGVAQDLDIDGAHYIACNGNLLLSFDGSGTVGGVTFDDEDVLEYDGTIPTWELAYDGSAAQGDWRPADLDALHATIDLGPGPAVVFGQTILAAADKETFEWLNPAGYDAVRGSFVTSSDIGTYALDASASGNDTFFTDVSVPQPGTGFWYLVRPGGCTLSSWQTILNGEPGRDVALP